MIPDTLFSAMEKEIEREEKYGADCLQKNIVNAQPIQKPKISGIDASNFEDLRKVEKLSPFDL